MEVETTLIGGLGSSSGAQQMGLIALQPNAATYVVEEPSLKGVDASLDFFIACWPILDPMARFQMAKETGKQHLVDPASQEAIGTLKDFIFSSIELSKKSATSLRVDY